MQMEFWVHCTAKVDGSYEMNCDGFKSCVLHYVAPLVVKDGLGLPCVSCDDSLEPFEFEGEVLMSGEVKFGFKTDTAENAFKILDQLNLWSIHFGCSQFSVRISERFSV